MSNRCRVYVILDRCVAGVYATGSASFRDMTRDTATAAQKH